MYVSVAVCLVSVWCATACVPVVSVYKTHGERSISIAWRRAARSMVLNAFSKSILSRILSWSLVLRWSHWRATRARTSVAQGCATPIYNGTSKMDACSWKALQRHLPTSWRQVAPTAVGLMPASCLGKAAKEAPARKGATLGGVRPETL